MTLAELEILKEVLRTELKRIAKEIAEANKELVRISQETSDALFARGAILTEIEEERFKLKLEASRVQQEKEQLITLRSELEAKEHHYGEETRKEAEVLASLRNDAHVLGLKIQDLKITEHELSERVRAYKQRLDHEKETEKDIRDAEGILDQLKKEIGDYNSELEQEASRLRQEVKELENRAQIAELREESAKEQYLQTTRDLEKKMKDWRILRQRLEVVYKEYYPDRELPLKE